MSKYFGDLNLQVLQPVREALTNKMNIANQHLILLDKEKLVKIHTEKKNKDEVDKEYKSRISKYEEELHVARSALNALESVRHRIWQLIDAVSKVDRMGMPLKHVSSGENEWKPLDADIKVLLAKLKNILLQEIDQSLLTNISDFSKFVERDLKAKLGGHNKKISITKAELDKLQAFAGPRPLVRASPDYPRTREDARARLKEQLDVQAKAHEESRLRAEARAKDRKVAEAKVRAATTQTKTHTPAKSPQTAKFKTPIRTSVSTAIHSHAHARSNTEERKYKAQSVSTRTAAAAAAVGRGPADRVKDNKGKDSNDRNQHAPGTTASAGRMARGTVGARRKLEFQKSEINQKPIQKPISKSARSTVQKPHSGGKPSTTPMRSAAGIPIRTRGTPQRITAPNISSSGSSTSSRSSTRTPSPLHTPPRATSPSPISSTPATPVVPGSFTDQKYTAAAAAAATNPQQAGTYNLTHRDQEQLRRIRQRERKRTKDRRDEQRSQEAQAPLFNAASALSTPQVFPPTPRPPIPPYSAPARSVGTPGLKPHAKSDEINVSQSLISQPIIGPEPSSGLDNKIKFEREERIAESTWEGILRQRQIVNKMILDLQERCPGVKIEPLPLERNLPEILAKDPLAMKHFPIAMTVLESQMIRIHEDRIIHNKYSEMYEAEQSYLLDQNNNLQVQLEAWKKHSAALALEIQEQNARNQRQQSDASAEYEKSKLDAEKILHEHQQRWLIENQSMMEEHNKQLRFEIDARHNDELYRIKLQAEEMLFRQKADYKRLEELYAEKDRELHRENALHMQAQHDHNIDRLRYDAISRDNAALMKQLSGTGELIKELQAENEMYKKRGVSAAGSAGAGVFDTSEAANEFAIASLTEQNRQLTEQLKLQEEQNIRLREERDAWARERDALAKQLEASERENKRQREAFAKELMAERNARIEAEAIADRERAAQKQMMEERERLVKHMEGLEGERDEALDNQRKLTDALQAVQKDLDDLRRRAGAEIAAANKAATDALAARDAANAQRDAAIAARDAAIVQRNAAQAAQAAAAAAAAVALKAERDAKLAAERDRDRYKEHVDMSHGKLPPGKGYRF